MKSRLFFSLVLLSGFFLTSLASAQRYSESLPDHLTFHVGGGFSTPTHAAGQDLDTGWDFAMGGGYKFNRYLSLNLDYGYNRWNLNDAALARFQEPGGRTSVWHLTLNPEVHFNPRGKVDFYTTAGFGLYHRDLILTEPVTATIFVCDPFFGFCFPEQTTINEVVAQFDDYKGGFNAGAGLSYRLGYSRMRFFSEARYERMFSSSGADLTYVPVTFGLRW